MTILLKAYNNITLITKKACDDFVAMELTGARFHLSFEE